MQFAMDAGHAACGDCYIDLMGLAARAVDLLLMVRVSDMSTPAVQGLIKMN
jgi:hypothetical protein